MLNLNPYMLWIKLGAAALGLIAAFSAGMWLQSTIKDKTILSMQRDTALAEAAAYKDGVTKQAAADRITHDRDVANAETHQKIVTVTQRIIQKVPIYVTAQTDALFPLPCGFVRLHDAAAAGIDPASIPIPSGHSDSDKCPVTASHAASIIAGNYALALGWRADLQSWEGWYSEQLAAWNKP